ncbi:MAG: right-handed parallel beta-helix repeat-containing protein [Chitinophagaceae bacterium]|nr:right-handed parallel beta-helix repeat-containing protein [Chitinophagaceae bacterium]
MIKRILLALLVVSLILISTSDITAQSAKEKVLTSGMKISSSLKIKRGVYRLATSNEDKPIIVVEGNNITIDFNNAELQGSFAVAGARERMPDEYAGMAILIRNSSNIVIKNLKARGYKIAIMATNVEQLRLDNCDLSYNYRQRLNSTQEKEDVSDWMSYHQNEKNEWLRYGAAIYLEKCKSAVVKNCKVTGGQNALMMTESNDGLIMGNDFSFNSGIGIGMYRSNRNKVVYNRLVFNVRGYSHGVYSRGQDSAGILVYEQSSHNLFFKNNATHSGDGFFLWAGQSTMDTGEGGCNDNIISDNNFSYAPTNGIEATFSRNKIVRNRMIECDYGIWGGYSYHTLIEGNHFRGNKTAIAIEHGQHNQVINNIFNNDKTAVRLWSRKEQPADWGYARHRDTRSVEHLLAANSFNGNQLVYHLGRTDSVRIFANSYYGVETMYKTDSTSGPIDSTVSSLGDAGDDGVVYSGAVPKPDPFAGSGKLAGRKNILVNEWGPHDFRSPIIWNTNPTDTGSLMSFDIIGPKGNWAIKRLVGLTSISSKKGVFPATITARKPTSKNLDVIIELEYVGESITTSFGKTVAAGKPYAFSFRKFFQPLNWEVLFFSMDTSRHNPITTGQLFSPLVRMAPFKRDTVQELSYNWWGGIKEKGEQHKQFITLASAVAIVPPGRYEISVTWDDAVKVTVDDKLIVDEWNPAKYRFDQSPNKKIVMNLGGEHRFHVEHLELGGFATISLKLKRL